MRPVTSSAVGRRRALTVAGATAAAVLLWIVAAATGVDFEVAAVGPPMTVSLPLVVAAALFASLAGWGALALLERRTSRARQIWTALAVAVLLISLVPLPTAEAPTATRVCLALMHISVGAVLIPGLRASAGPTASGDRSSARRWGRAAGTTASILNRQGVDPPR